MDKSFPFFFLEIKGGDEQHRLKIDVDILIKYRNVKHFIEEKNNKTYQEIVSNHLTSLTFLWKRPVLIIPCYSEQAFGCHVFPCSSLSFWAIPRWDSDKRWWWENDRIRHRDESCSFFGWGWRHRLKYFFYRFQCQWSVSYQKHTEWKNTRKGEDMTSLSRRCLL